MTVAELVEKLQKFDQELLVCAVNTDCNPIDDYYDISDVYQITGSDRDAVNGCFIVHG